MGVKLFSQATIKKLKSYNLYEYGISHPLLVKDLQDLMFRESTGIYDLYKNLGYPPIGKGGILLRIDDFLENLSDGSNLWGLEEDERSMDSSRYYIRLQSAEGGESWYYYSKSDEIYLCSWGSEKAMILGQLKASFSSSYKFVNWMYDQD